MMSTEVEDEEEVDVGEPARKPMRQHAVVLLDDDEHTFNYVVETLLKVFKYKVEKCVKLTVAVHNDKRAIVFTGTLELCELKKEQIQSCGTDFYAAKPVTWPLGVDIEPLLG